jgi:hypothetical protein
MSQIDQDIAGAAANAAEASAYWGFGPADLDYSERSLVAVEKVLGELAAARGELTDDQLDGVVQDFGCYVLEVGRREFGGRYAWFDRRAQPVLVVGEPAFRVAMITWDKVRGRLTGDEADNIPFFYAGFAGRARAATPGDDALYV